MAGMEPRRSVAVKIPIGELLAGRFERGEGLAPNYVLTPLGRRVSRAWLTGTVVSKFQSEDGNYSSITIDDSTGQIRAKAFGGSKILADISQGDIVDVIGKVREYNGEVHVIPEAVAKITQMHELMRKLEQVKLIRSWMEKRMAVLEARKEASDLEELKRLCFERHGIPGEDVESIISSLPEDKEDEREIILKLIAEIDRGDGASYSELLEKSGLPEDVFDRVMTSLLEEGLCFEPRPGRIKKVES